MRISNLLFRDSFVVDASYDKIVSFVKLKLDDTYFKGRIDKEEIQVFFKSKFFDRPLSSNLPFIQLNVKNNADKNGKIKIWFKLVDVVAILFVLSNLIILFLSLVNLN